MINSDGHQMPDLEVKSHTHTHEHTSFNTEGEDRQIQTAEQHKDKVSDSN